MVDHESTSIEIPVGKFGNSAPSLLTRLFIPFPRNTNPVNVLIRHDNDPTTVTTLTTKSLVWHDGLDPDTATGTASLQATGGIVGVKLTKAGFFYVNGPPTISFNTTSGTTATAIARLEATPISPIVTVTNEGSGYTPNATVTVTFTNAAGDTGSGAAGSATADESGAVEIVDITNVGSGYRTPPTVVLSSPTTGSNVATATIQLNQGVIESINVTNIGSGYAATDTVNVVASTGTQGAASIQFGATLDDEGYDLTNGGGGYGTDTPDIAITDDIAVGIGAAATATVVANAVTAINLDAGGEGSGFSIQPQVAISGGGGSGAAAYAIMDGNGGIDLIVVTAGGTGYTSVPTVSFVQGGSGADVTATLTAGVVSAITAGNDGANYITPRLTFSEPTGGVETKIFVTEGTATLSVLLFEATGGLVSGSIQIWATKVDGVVDNTSDELLYVVHAGLVDNDFIYPSTPIWLPNNKFLTIKNTGATDLLVNRLLTYTFETWP